MGRLVIAIGLAAVLLIVGGDASADDPRSALRLAVDKTGATKSAHLELRHTTRSAERSVESRTSASFSRGDQDVVTQGDAGDARRVAVGTAVYERRPNTPGARWRTSTRPAPAADAPFAALTLRDGTSLGDAKLYRSVTDAGVETLPQGAARKLVAELDMAAVATAMQLSADDAARLARMSATATLWIAQADGRVARHVLTIVVPTATGPTTIESTIDLTDLDAPIVITPP